MNDIIKIENLKRVFKSGDAEIIAVNDLTFSVPEGQFMAITGKSGSGKSTLLYQLGLLDHPTSGNITIAGISVEKLRSDDRTNFRLNFLGYVFQDYAVLPSLTAEENVMVPLLMQGMSVVDAREKTDRALEKVGLLHRKGNTPSQLSGGEQQRVSIARAIVHNPKILFADEPTANLDTETSKSILDAFLELNRQGQTIIMVTHEEEYARLAHRIINLADGKIIKDTTK
ncbi:MAG: ABC transporter ATP-binding protein [Candidatus Pacebacteria bacterium]|jgi:putative ABC transport system ATP-binding protein|nr:ABC transporter ATP-binding protein [Candidatus Paceibacterota bacterium]MBP9058484.1 ABC transporter ATP-binding protein [Candidatus Paceibacterota bacterium]MBP9770469.1 ABC transporter ATP-binding protein [Candidatus Paceibacterota bacterium]